MPIFDIIIKPSPNFVGKIYMKMFGNYLSHLIPLTPGSLAFSTCGGNSPIPTRHKGEFRGLVSTKRPNSMVRGGGNFRTLFI